MSEYCLRAGLQTQEQSSADFGLLPPLPDTQEEVEDNAEVLGAVFQRDIFSGVAANEVAVKGTDLSKYNVIAFATHGLVPGDLDGLDLPALAFSSRSLVGDSQDGLLTLGEIFELRLNADWVVLSACNTGTGDTADSEALSGLGWVFCMLGHALF